MKITFTKCIYEDYEVDVPYEEFVERFVDSKYEAVLEYMHKASKIGEEVEIDCLELGKLDDEDEAYLDRASSQDEADIRALNADYLAGLL